MNSINAAQRDRVAAQSLAEADKIKRVTQARRTRRPCASTVRVSPLSAVRSPTASRSSTSVCAKSASPHSAEQLLMMTQYFDTMQDVARGGRSNVLFMPSNPGGMGEMMDQIRNSLYSNQANERGIENAEQDDRQQADVDSRRARQASQMEEAAQQRAHQEAARRQGMSQSTGGAMNEGADLTDRAQQWAQNQRGIPPQPPRRP